MEDTVEAHVPRLQGEDSSDGILIEAISLTGVLSDEIHSS